MTSAPERVVQWRRQLLTRALLASGAIVSVGVLLLLFVPKLAPLRIAVFVGVPVAGLQLALVRAPATWDRVRRGALLIGGFCVFAAGVALAGWAPFVVALGAFLVTVVGLLSGRRALVTMVVATAALFGVVGVLAVQGHLPPQPAPLDPSSMHSWLLVAIGFTVISAGLGATVLGVLRTHRRARASAEAALLAAQNQTKATIEAGRARLEAERSLRDTQKLQAVGELSDGLAHLFTNALMVIRGTAESLRRASGSSEADAAVEDLRAATRRAAEAATELLAFSRTSGEGASSVDLQASLQEFRSNLERVLPADVRLTFRTVPVGMVLGEETRIRQLLLNLLLNARDALGAGGQVEVGLMSVTHDEAFSTEFDRLPAGRYAVLTVRDDGAGLDPERLGRAVEPFFTTKSPKTHAGLGLSVAHSIVRASEGGMHIASALGSGTTVTIYWPVVEGASDLPGGRTAPGPASGLEPRPVPPSEPIWDPSVPMEAAPKPWREPSLHRLAGRLSLVYGGALLILLILGRGDFLWRSAGTCGLGLLVFIGTYRRRDLPYRWRARALISACAATSIGFLWLLSFAAPGGLVVLLMSTVVAASFGSVRTWLSLVVLTSLAFVVGGWAYAEGWLATPELGLSLASGANWARVTLVYPLSLLALAYCVLPVSRAAEASVVDMQDRLHELRRRQAESADAVAARLEVEDDLARAERIESVGRAAGKIAHDINNALQVIMAWGDVLSMGVEDGGRTKEQALRGVGLAVENAETLVRQFDVGLRRASQAAEVEDLAASTRGAAQMLRSLLPPSLALDVEADGPCFVSLRPGDARQVIVNLAMNAKDAMPDGGRLSIRVGLQDDQVHLVVEDDGVGMTDETRARLFEAFFTTKAARRGTGLGLSTVQEIVSANQGTIEVTSALGEGTRFLVRLPVRTAPPERAPAPVRDATASTPARLLLAEDEPAVRAMMVRWFQDAGFTVVEAKDGDAAMSRIHSSPVFDALCIDGVMPGCPCDAVIEAFQSRWPGAPVVVCSGHLPPVLAERALDRWGASFVSKPCSGEELVGRVVQLLAADRPEADRVVEPPR